MVDDNSKTSLVTIGITLMIVLSLVFLYFSPVLFICSSIYGYFAFLTEYKKDTIAEEIGKFVGFLLLISIVVFTYTSFFGNEDINSIFCKNELKFKGYVYAFPDDTKDKNYRLKADVQKDGNEYSIDRIYFYNGGYIEFESCEDGNKGGNSFYCTPVNDERDWTFRFYGEMIKEKKGASYGRKRR